MTVPTEVFDAITHRMDEIDAELVAIKEIIKENIEAREQLEKRYKELAEFINPPKPFVGFEMVSEDTGKAIRIPEEKREYIKPRTIDEMQKRAQELGMSYGEYQVYLKNGGQG